MSAPQFTDATPVFCVRDLAASLRHYVEVLGFYVQWRWSPKGGFEGDAPTFACVKQGDITLFLGQESQGVPGAWLMLSLQRPADVDALHAAYAEAGAQVRQAPIDRSWGMREMLVADLDGNVLRIGAPIGAP